MTREVRGAAVVQKAAVCAEAREEVTVVAEAMPVRARLAGEEAVETLDVAFQVKETEAAEEVVGATASVEE